jgi:hypothetical protein
MPPCDHDECPPTRCLLTPKPYGHEVDVEFCDRMLYIPGSSMNTVKTYAYRGSASRARSAVRIKTHYRAILEIRPLTQEVFERTYGLNQRM